MIECKNCKSQNISKNGIARKKQRYKCKDCRYNFVVGHAYYTPQKQAKKALVALLYTLGKGSHRMLGKIFGVSNGTIGNWTAEAADGLPEIAVPDDIVSMEFDEMWHYIGKKNESCGYSRQLTAAQVEWLRGCWASATRKPSSGSMPK
jgi:transposase-like protein